MSKDLQVLIAKGVGVDDFCRYGNYVLRGVVNRNVRHGDM